MAENTDPNAETEEHPAGLQPRLKQWIITYAPLLAAVVTAILFVLIIASLFWPFLRFSGMPETTLLRELADSAVARGLITFLVAVSTVGIALILTVYAVATQDPKAKENFAMAKEVLSSLVGVLGTIVGFYFGSTTTPPAQAVPPPPAQVSALRVESVTVQPSEVKNGDTVTVRGKIMGGKLPYDYTINFQPESIPPLQHKSSRDGSFEEKVVVPQGIAPGTTVEMTISAKDQAGGSITFDKPVQVRIGP